MNEAIKFALWIGGRGLEFDQQTNTWKGMFGRIEVSTEELYELWSLRPPTGMLMVVPKDMVDSEWEEVNVKDYPDYTMDVTEYSKLIRKL